MPLQNRVLPDGSIVADPARGLFTGNRGVLHDDHRRLTRRWTTRAWICCRLDWKDVRRVPMSPGTWTELFFLDEAVALSAGHRPCGYCRRPEYQRFRAAWAAALGPADPRAPQMDAVLHQARRAGPWEAPAESLPPGAFVRTASGPALKTADGFILYTPAGYSEKLTLTGPVPVLTPAPMTAILSAGYTPTLHPTASLL